MVPVLSVEVVKPVLPSVLPMRLNPDATKKLFSICPERKSPDTSGAVVAVFCAIMLLATVVRYDLSLSSNDPTTPECS